MTRGKQTCKILKDIRRQIAEANDIEYVTSECRYRGDCLGTCPKCEAEVRYIEQQLRARRLAGKAVALAGISAGMIFVSGCDGRQVTSTSDTLPNVSDEHQELVGSQIVSAADSIDTVMVTGDNTARKNNQKVVLTSIAIMGDPEIEAELNRRKNAKEVSDECDTVATVTKISCPVVGEVPDEHNKVEKESPKYETIYNYDDADKKPEYPGGMTALMKFVTDNLNYPDIQGDVSSYTHKVVVGFIVTESGKVTSPELLKGGDALLEAAALRVVGMLPDFIPGEHDGVPVSVYYTLPITVRSL